MCHVLVKFSPLFGDHRLQRAGRGSRRFRSPRQWTHWWETEQQTRGLNQDCYVSVKSANVQANAIGLKIRFFSYWYRNLLFFQNKSFSTFGQIVATSDCLVRSSYPQLHGIVNLIQIQSFKEVYCAIIMAGQKFGTSPVGMSWDRKKMIPTQSQLFAIPSPDQPPLSF